MATVLIVEDEALVARDLRDQVGRFGYEVAGVLSDGLSAVEHVRARAPTAILMDVGLRGGMDGVETCRQILAIAAIPVIFVTAHNDVITRARIQALRPTGWMTKPFHASQLRAALQRACGPARRRRQVPT